MFQLLPCSICQRTFSLRKEVAEDARLKCPNCGNQFRLGDVLDAFYSPWIVVEDEPQSSIEPTQSVAPTDAKLSFENLLNTHDVDPNNLLARSNAITDDASEFAADNVFESQSALTDSDLELDDLQMADGIATDAVTELAIEQGSPLDEASQPALGIDNPTPNSQIKRPRARKGDKGGLWSIIQVVLGGAAAIPVTLLLLWYVVGKDIAGAGPIVAQYAPWIVPQKFRSPAENIPVRTGPRVPPPALGEGGFRDFAAELNANRSPAAEENTPVTATAPGSADPGTSNTDAAPADVTANRSTDSDSANRPTEDTQMRDAFKTVKDAKQKISQWDPTSPEKTKLISELFTELVKLSEHMASFPTTGGAMNLLKNDLQEIGRFIASKDVRSDFAKLQLAQFNPQSPPTSGGRVFLSWAKEVSETDTHWIVTHPDQDLTIEVPKQSIVQLQPGDKFFCMGSVSSAAATGEASAPKKTRISASFFQTF